MKAFVHHEGLVAPLDRANVDTDQIIPKQFLKSIKRTGFGPNLFDEWRYLDVGEPGQDCAQRPLNPEFVLRAQPALRAQQHRVDAAIRQARIDDHAHGRQGPRHRAATSLLRQSRPRRRGDDRH